MNVSIVERRWFSFITAMARTAAVCIAIATACSGQQDANAATSGATLIDHAHLFAARDNSAINRTAAAAGLRFIVVTDNQSPEDGASWMQHTIATYGAPGVVLLAIHADLADPSQSLVAVWSGNALGLTSAEDQTEANMLVAANPSAPLADRVNAMIGRLQADNDAGLRSVGAAAGAAATAVQIGRGIRSITALMVILAWVFVFIRRRRSSTALALPTRFVGGVIFILIALLWLDIAWKTINIVIKADPTVTTSGSPGYVAGTMLVDLVVVLGAVSVVRRLMRRHPHRCRDERSALP